VFAGEATYLVNRAQADDLAGRNAGYLDMFRGLGEPVACHLEGFKPGRVLPLWGQPSPRYRWTRLA